jgi:hypothetical protein
LEALFIMLSDWFTLYKKNESRSAASIHDRRKHSRFQPRLESLEDRYLPANLTVSTNADTGAGSLRAALTTANADSTPDTIVFAPNLSGQTVTLASALPDIHANGLTIMGPGASSLAVSGNHAVTVFTIGAGIQNVTISGFTISGGKGTVSGGGILNQGQLTLNGVTLSGSTAVFFGGGIASLKGGQLSIRNCLISNNSAN